MFRVMELELWLKTEQIFKKRSDGSF